MKNLTLSLLTLLLLLVSNLSFGQTTYHVRSTDGNDNNNGTSWTTAYATVQKALAEAQNGDQIWIAAGTYYPDEGPNTTNNDRDHSFTMKTGVHLYGGFPSTGTPTFNDRDWTNHETILSGDIDQNDDYTTNLNTTPYTVINNDNNSYHVIQCANGTTNALLDGCSIVGGHADEGGNSRGGGLLNSGELSIANAQIRYNVASNSNIFSSSAGGGMLNESNSTAILSNCAFSHNYCNSSGNNSFNFGGGMLNFGTATLSNCAFSHNYCNSSGSNSSFGGGMDNIGTAILNNCAFSHNYCNSNSNSSFGGGMSNSVNSTATLTNCAFSHNYCNSNSNSSFGGGMFNEGTTTLTNCILWGNTADSDPNYHFNNDNITYTLIQGQNPSGTGNIDGNTDPKFVDAPNGNLRLQADSPLIDQGTTINAPSFDFDELPRPMGNGVDIGISEHKVIGCTGNSPILYVNQAVSISGNGQSWTTAFSQLQDALTFARNCPTVEEIWVAAGTYYPDQGIDINNNDRAHSFSMISNVKIYGGFSSTGTPPFNDRDWTNHETILSGDIDQNDDYTTNLNTTPYTVINNNNNSYHVIQCANGTTNALLDGCSIVGGHADDGGNSRGGGVLNSGELTIINTQIRYNVASSSSSSSSSTRGGGMFNRGTVTLTNCAFSHNYCSSNSNSSSITRGGGMFNESNSTATLTNCAFSHNYCNSFSNTSSLSYGGGIFNDGTATLNNCAFSHNYCNSFSNTSSLSFGGGMYNDETATLNNCAFSHNYCNSNSSSLSFGGGMYNDGTTTFTNCILWGNTANNNPNYRFDNDNITYTLIGGQNPSGTGNIDGSTNPMFIDAPNGNLRLSPCSPLINKGDNSPFQTGGAAQGITTDLDGNDRIVNNTIDLGPFETSLDTEKPMIAALNNIAENTATGTCTKAITWTHPKLMDNRPFTGACVPQLFTYEVSGQTTQAATNLTSYDGSTMATLTFNLGVSTVTYQATDAAGNMAEPVSFTVTITDNQAPTFTCINSDQNFNTDLGNCTYTITDNSLDPSNINDNCSTVTTTYTLTGATTASGGASLINQVFNLGITTVTFTFADQASPTNQNTCSFEVIVTDNQAPTFTCINSDQNFNTDLGNCTYTITDNSLDPSNISDNCSTVATTYTLTGATTASGGASLINQVFNLGTTTATFTFADQASPANQNTCSFEVIVADNQAPVVNCQALTITLDQNGNYDLTSNDLAALANATDNCDALNLLAITADKNTFDCSNLGDNPISIQVEDSKNNQSPICPTTLSVLAPTSTMEITSSNTSIIETDAGTSIEVQITRSNAICAASVNYATADGTATAGQDYTPVSGTLQFASGELTKSLTINILGETTNETDETFTVQLSNPTNNNTLTIPSIDITIINDDSPYTSLDFDGDDDLVTIPNFSFAPQFTIEFWIFYQGQHQNFEALTTIFENNTFFFVLGLNEGHLNVVGTFLESNTKIPINQWTHVALTYQGSQFKAFFNGNLVASEQSNGAFTFPNQQALDIGKSDIFDSPKMIIDDFRIWNQSRSAQQIQDNKDCSLSGQENDLSYYFNFDQAIPFGDNQNISNIPNLVNNQASATLHHFNLTGMQSNFIKGGPMIDHACANNLAVEWLQVSAQATDKQQVAVQWTVSQEWQTTHYEVERSQDGKTFTSIGKVLATQQEDYLFYDQNPHKGANYYRIKEVETSGKTSFSQVVIAQLLEDNKSAFQVFPNPTTGQANITWTTEQAVQQISLWDALGRKIAVKTISPSEQSYSFDLSQFSAGVYFVKIETAAQNWTQLVVKE